MCEVEGYALNVNGHLVDSNFGMGGRCGTPMRMPHPAADSISEGRLARFGLSLAGWTERWFPDPLVFAFIGVLFVYAAGVVAGESPSNLALQAGKSFWALIPFTMQMVMGIVGGYVVAATPVVRRAVRGLAGISKAPKTGIAVIALFGVLASVRSWGVGVVFGVVV